MINNELRIGRFTSSNIHRLVTNGRAKDSIGSPFYTYVNEKRNELRMGRSFDIGAYSQSMAWGNFMETVVFNLLGTDYSLTSKGTLVHPDFEYWAGTTDCEKFKAGKKFAAAEIKCYEPKKWAEYTNALLLKDIQNLKDNFKEEYWQIVSNACILGVGFGEAITFMPYESQMDNLKDEKGNIIDFGIRQMAENFDGNEQWQYRFIVEKENWQLPVLPNGGYYKNINKFEFEIPKEDIELLTNRIEIATKELLK